MAPGPTRAGEQHPSGAAAGCVECFWQKREVYSSMAESACALPNGAHRIGQGVKICHEGLIPLRPRTGPFRDTTWDPLQSPRGPFEDSFKHH